MIKYILFYLWFNDYINYIIYMSETNIKFIKIDTTATKDPMDSLSAVLGNTSKIKFNAKTTRYLTDK